MKKLIKVFILVISIISVLPLFSGGSQESAGSSTRGRYLAGQGIIIPPEEIFPESYIASIDYAYPDPTGDLGVSLYTGNRQVSRFGTEGIIHIGIQGKSLPYDELPPMNLVFIIDTSSSMNEDDKISWVREAFEIFINKVRDDDYVSLVEFNDNARVIFPSTRIDTDDKRQSFLDAVNSLSPQGGSNLERGLEAGYQQVLSNYRENYINRVLFLSDGTEFSARLAREGAKSGDVRVSLLWNNRNDLDLHVVTPLGEEIYYGATSDTSGGMLDVDMNVSGETIKPVENIFWGKDQAPTGTYRVFVENYSFNEERHEPYGFQVEVKNGDEFSHFDGIVKGSGENSRIQVTEFSFMTDRAKRLEKDVLYQLAGSYREIGINISTIGVGIGFDVDLMRNLAREGGGSSRFISDREEMEKIFDSEFDRMVVPVAFDLDIEVELLSGTRMVETWGYNNSIRGNRIEYSLPTLHLRDYETIVIRYQTPVLDKAVSRGQELPIFRFNLSYKDLNRKEIRLEPEIVNMEVAAGQADLTGISDGVVLRSGSILNFAEGIIDIGTLYYGAMDLASEGAGDEAETRMIFNGNLVEARNLSVELKDELENAALRLDDDEIFADQIEILENYIPIIEEDIDPAYLRLPEDSEPETGGLLAGNTEALMDKLSELFREMSLTFTEETGGTAALLGFTSGEAIDPAFLSFINETARNEFAGAENLRLVERERLDEIIDEQKLVMTGIMDTDSAIEIGRLLTAEYIITGTILPAGSRTIIFGRIIHIETGEIVNAAQIFLDKTVE